MRKVGAGFCWNDDIVIVGDVVKNRFSLNNPWVVMEIYAIGNNYYIYHVERGYENLEYKLKKLDVDIIKQRGLRFETEEKKSSSE